MRVTAQRVLNFIVAREKASECMPLRLGNVDFWHPIPGFPVNLCYSLPIHQWDAQTIQDDINRLAANYWSELIQYLEKEQQP